MSVTTPAVETRPSLPFLPRTTVAMKVIVAITGAGLLAFVFMHMLGNLQIFLGAEKLNEYAHFLKSNPELLWPARIGLLVLFTLHVTLTIILKRRTPRARRVGYVHNQLLETTTAGRYMLLTGLVVLAFVLYHLAHFTLGMVHMTPPAQPVTLNVPSGEAVAIADGPVAEPVLTSLHDGRDAQGHHDVYGMVVGSFRNPVVSMLYIAAQLVLAIHLFHGATSLFQTLGLNQCSIQPLLNRFGLIVALIIALGNCSIPAAVLAGIIH